MDEELHHEVSPHFSTVAMFSVVAEKMGKGRGK
jgi:hypothetical protein